MINHIILGITVALAFLGGVILQNNKILGLFIILVVFIGEMIISKQLNKLFAEQREKVSKE